MWNDEAASVLLSRTMDHLGYGLPMVRLRQQFYDSHPGLLYDFVIFAGSKAEGLSNVCESDYDMLGVVPDVICTTNPIRFVNTENNVSVFHLDNTDTAPGYAKLILEKPSRAVEDEEYKEMLFGPVSANTYLSSDKWRESFKLTETGWSFATPLPQSKGPSNPISFLNGYFCDDCDVVAGIICDCPELLQSWLDRPRKHSWPSADILRQVSTMEAYVVPVGYKGSPLQFLEWRICFTKAEIKIIRSFNDCQIKLLILLKWLSKSCLKPICKEITSYVMKNLVMWMVERLPEQYFTENNLLNALHIALRTLKRCLISKCLPSYMIPDRNLLADRLSAIERSRVCTMIDSLLQQGQQIVIRCEKIRDAYSILLRSPETFFSYTKKQLQSNIAYLCFVQTGIDLENEEEQLRTIQIIMPDLFELSISGIDVDQISQIFQDRFIRLLS